MFRHEDPMIEWLVRQTDWYDQFPDEDVDWTEDEYWDECWDEYWEEPEL